MNLEKVLSRADGWLRLRIAMCKYKEIIAHNKENIADLRDIELSDEIPPEHALAASYRELLQYGGDGRTKKAGLARVGLVLYGSYGGARGVLRVAAGLRHHAARLSISL